MARRIFDFRCTSCSHIDEEYTTPDATIRCSKCGGDSVRIISPVATHLEGCSGDFPGAAMRWERDRKRRIENERKSQQ